MTYCTNCQSVECLGCAPSILDERERTHGPYLRTATHYDELRLALELPSASPMQRMALDMIAAKLARILAGNPNEPDHWRDIAGYAELVLRSLAQKCTHCGREHTDPMTCGKGGCPLGGDQ